MLGPHFYFDLVRLARKRSNLYVRCGFLVALGVGWWYVYEASKPFDDAINSYARLAASFTYLLLAVQYVMVFLMAPIYLAGAISEEKEHRTLELLFQTQLTDREILLGKFGARVVHLMFLVLLSLPMLAIISLWGGIDMELLAFHFACLLLLILVTGSAALWASVSARHYQEAIILAYVLEGAAVYILVLPVAGVASVINLDDATNRMWMAPLVAMAAVALSYYSYRMSLWDLRKLREKNGTFHGTTPPKRKPQTSQAPRKWSRPTRAVSESALLWKEMIRCRATVDYPRGFLWIGFGGACMLGCFATHWHFSGARLREDLDALPGIFCAGYAGLTFLALLTTVPSTALTVAREREKQTLDFLLLLPVERWEILLAKAAAPWAANRLMFGMLLALPLVGIMFGLFRVHSGLALLLLPWPSLLFVNALALLLTVICGRVRTTFIALGVILLLLFALHLLRYRELGLILTGIGCFFGETEIPREFGDATADDAIHMLLVHQSIMLSAAAVLVGLAFWLFNRRR